MLNDKKKEIEKKGKRGEILKKDFFNNMILFPQNCTVHGRINRYKTFSLL